MVEKILAILLGAAASAAGSQTTASIDMAIVHRQTSKTAILEIREADDLLMARCLNDHGLDQNEVALASIALEGTEVSLFQGPRRISIGKIISVETASDGLLPCTVQASAEFDRPLPITARGDVLWATNKKLPSTPREPVRSDVEEIARGVLPGSMSKACLDQRTVVRRGTSKGTYVGFTCREGNSGEQPVSESSQGSFSGMKNVYSALVFIPKPGSSARGAQPESAQPKIVLTEEGSYGTLSLVDVLDPKKSDGKHELVMRREWDEHHLNRLELWVDNGNFAQPAGSESQAADMMFLLSEDAATGFLDDFIDTSDEGIGGLHYPHPSGRPSGTSGIRSGGTSI